MVSHRELEKIVEQVNDSYKVMLDKITSLEIKVEELTQNKTKVKK